MKRYAHLQSVTAAWFGKGQDQIKVQKVRGQDKYKLTYHGETHILTGYDYQQMLDEVSGYKNREAFFKSTYWKTDVGQKRQLQQADDNFLRAIQRMQNIPYEMQGYAIQLWKNLRTDIKERFWDLNAKLVEEVFRYVDGARYNNKIGLADEPDRTNADDIEALQHLINKLESYYSPEELASVREKAVQSQLTEFY